VKREEKSADSNDGRRMKEERSEESFHVTKRRD
jgi:hypothetical protein